MIGAGSVRRLLFNIRGDSMRQLKRWIIGLLMICLIGFGLYHGGVVDKHTVNDAIVDVHNLFPKEPIQLTDYAKEVKAKLISPDFQNISVNSEFTLEGIIEKTDRLSVPYVWAKIDFLDDQSSSSSFNYYIPIHNQKFLQRVKLFAGTGDYLVTIKVPSPDDKEKFYNLSSFKVHNVSPDPKRDIEYNLNAMEKELQIENPVSGNDQVDRVFHFSGSVSERTKKILVQMTKDGQVWKRTVSTRKGKFSEKIPLLFGKGTYEVKVMVPSKREGYYIDGASFYLRNVASESFQPIRYTHLYHERGIKLLKPLTSGDQADLYYKIAGEIDPNAPYAKQTKRLIVQTVKGEDKATYFIPVKQFRFEDSIPFRFGPGKYEVTLFVPDLQNKNREYFRFYNVATFDVTSYVDKDYRDLLPSRGIQPNHPVIKELAKRVTAGKKTDRQKAKAIFRFVATYMDYDMHKLRTDGFDWDDSDLKSYYTRKGVCQDYVFLGLSMLRSLNIPSRFVEGEAGNQRHAWIEVLINGQWLTMDPTWGSGYITPDGRFIKRYDERYFDPPTRFFQKTHRRTGVVY